MHLLEQKLEKHDHFGLLTTVKLPSLLGRYELSKHMRNNVNKNK